MGKLNQLPHEVADRIGPYYVYALVDPRTNGVFYIGKGKGQRLLHHGIEADLAPEKGQGAKVARIQEIRGQGLEPVLDVVRHGLNEADALLVEAALIDTVPGLTNKVSGHGAAQGRTPLVELVQRYGAVPIGDDAPPALTIRLFPWTDFPDEIQRGYTRRGHGYYHGMSVGELADSTRAWWKLSPGTLEKRNIQYAVAVYEGVTRGVFKIDDLIEPRKDGRRAFMAKPVLDGPVWEAWVGELGRRLEFPKGAQNSVMYWPRTAASAPSDDGDIASA